MRNIVKNTVIRRSDPIFGVCTVYDHSEPISLSDFAAELVDLAVSDTHFTVDALGPEIVRLCVYLWDD